MAEPFLGEIRLLSFNFPPKGWALCNGQLLPINQNQALFALLGTQYGGNGQTTFALPDLRGRVAIHQGNGHTPVGERGGATSHTLALPEMPKHTHRLKAASASSTDFEPANNVLATPGANIYIDATPDQTLAPAGVTSVGGSQPHENMAPYLTLNYCIALQGIFPSRN